MPVDPRQAVVICTRNRPADLRRALASIAAQRDPPRVVVVDASGEAAAEQNRARVAQLFPEEARYLAYRGAPSSARQRNAGLDRLPAPVEVVHFVDDDVTVQPGYFHRLAEALRETPALGGVGATVTEPDCRARSRRHERPKRFFLLSGAVPGRVLPSGVAVPAQLRERGEPTASSMHRVEWLNGASSYRRAVFEEARFDPALTGYALHEDLDFSYRVGRAGWELAVVPGARLVHHASGKNRYDAARLACTKVVHRRWFVEKNLRHPLRRAAFWWSVAGRFAALLASSDPRRGEALRGLAQGVRAVVRRTHPLLRRRSSSNKRTVGA